MNDHIPNTPKGYSFVKELRKNLFFRISSFTSLFILLCLSMGPYFMTTDGSAAPLPYKPVIYGLALALLMLGFYSVFRSYRFEKKLLGQYVLMVQSGTNLSSAGETTLQTLFHSSNEAMLLLKNNRLIDCNRKAQEVLQGNQAQMMGKDFKSLEMTNRKDRILIQQIERLLTRNRVNKQDDTLIWEWEEPKGELRKTKLSLISYHSAHHYYQVVVLRDLTHQWQTELALKDSEERFRLMVEKAPIGIATIDIDGNIIDVNPENLAILGSPSAEATRGVNVLTFPPWVEAGIAKDFGACLQQGKSGVYEQEYKTKWGKMLNLRYVLTPLQDADGRITGAISIMEDFTEYKKSREELNRLHEQTRKDAETKELLLKEVNHRVKNNLAGIIGMLYATSRFSRQPESREEYLSTLDNLIHRIEGMAIVHEILSESNWAPLPLDELTNRIINNCLQALPIGTQIDTDIAAQEQVTVSPKFAGNLGMVINELATNTIKHSLNGRNTARITVRISIEEDEVELVYHDDGQGFPENILAMKGFNTGMYLSQSIVQDGLAGSLTLRNENGAQSIIRFKNRT